MKTIHINSEVEMIANMSLHKSKTLDFLKSLEPFLGEKSNLKKLRKKVGKKIPYEEELSKTIIESRNERI